MKRTLCTAGVAALVTGAMTLASAASPDDTPSIKDVMVKLHKGANSPLAQVKTALKAASPDWKVVQDKSKDFVILGAALAKNDPPKGDKAGYMKLADAYFTNSKALDDAAKKEDKAGATAAVNKLGSSCMACHKDHRGK